MANIKKITLNGTTYTIVDSTAVHTVDSAISSSSTNPVQNKVIKAELDKKGTIIKLTSTQTSAFGDYYAFPVTLADITAINSAHDGIAVSFSSGSAFGINETFVAFGNEETLLNGITYLAYSGIFTSANSIESNTFIIMLPKTGDSTGGTGYIKVGITKQYVDFGDTKIPYGKCDATSTSTLYTATVPGITELKDGVCMLLKNGVINSEANFTININNLGAKPAYTNMAAATRESTIFNAVYTMMFIYDETRVSGGCWICYRGYDSNTNTVGYQLRTNSSTMVASAAFVRYRLLFTSADGTKWVPANTSTSTNATAARTVLQTPIDPFGEIVYYGSTTAVSANDAVGATVLWQQYTLTLGYSFNRTGAALTLTTNRPVYIKCAPQTNGSAIIDATTPYVQSLPSTADGKIYIYLGRAYSATAVELTMNHPVYYYNGGIRLWTGINIAGANYYGTCSTAAGTAAKVVTCTDFVLVAGARISVKFTNGSTSTDTMQLNVNGTGAKSCVNYLYNGSPKGDGFNCEKNEILEFVYDGTYWVVQTEYYLRNSATSTSRPADFNTYFSGRPNSGLQYTIGGANTANRPANQNAALIHAHWDTSGYDMQLGIVPNYNNNVGARLFSRAQLGTGSSWSEWKEFPRLSGALTNGQIVVSDESTGQALLKGITYDYKLTLSTTFTDVDADTISFSLSNDQLTGLNDYMSSAVSGGYTGMVHVSFTAPLPNSDTHEAVYIAHSALLDEYDMKWVFSGTVYDCVDKTTYPFTFSYPIASTGPVTATVKLNRASGGGSLNPVENSDVFLSRSVNFGENKYKFPSLVGGTVAWNQLVQNGGFSSVANWVMYRSSYTVSNGEATLTIADTYTAGSIYQDISIITDHVLFVAVDAKVGTATSAQLYLANNAVEVKSVSSTNYERVSFVVKCTGTAAQRIQLRAIGSGGNTVMYRNAECHDLTLALGPTIADYIYSLETATTGAGVNWFKQYFPKSYYPYNAGALVSVNPTGAEATGVNAWDEEWDIGYINTTTGENASGSSNIRSKNYIQVVPNVAYYAKTATATTANGLKMFYYDSEKNYISCNSGYQYYSIFTTPSNCYFIRFYRNSAAGTTYNHDICINISNPLYNGTYYPYTHHSYSISPLELRGVPKLVSNKLAFDGDVRASDGTVTRKYREVNLTSFSGAFGATSNGYAVFINSWGITRDDAVNKSLCSRFAYSSAGYTSMPVYSWFGSSGALTTFTFILPSTVTSLAEANTWLQNNPTTVLIPLATPTTESSAALPVPQVVYDGGTESFIDERDVQMPVGQDATYMDATNAIGELMDSGLVPSSGGANESEGYFLVTDGATSSDTWHYYKVGKQVTVSGLYTGTSSTATSLSELPFTPKYSLKFMLPVMMISPSMMFYLCQVSISANSKTIGTSGHFSSAGSNLTGSWLNIGEIHSTPITFTYITDD